MRPKSLKNTLLLTIAVLVIVSGMLISTVVTHRYSASLMESAVFQARHIAHNLALDAADKILINDLVALQKMLEDQILSHPSVDYLFVIKEGRIITHTFSGGIPVDLISANTSDDLELGHIEKLVNDQGQHCLDVAWPIFAGKAGVLRLGYSEQHLRMQVKELGARMILITAAILGAALLATYLFIFKLTRPLVTLTRAVAKIDEGNLETRVQVAGREEVNLLADTFNGMLDRLKDYLSRLEFSNSQLTEKNLELDRAHHQLRTSFAISQEMSSLTTLKEVGSYLIDTFQNIVECRHMALVVFSSGPEEMFLIMKDQKVSLTQRAAGLYRDVFVDTGEVGFLKMDAVAGVPLPEVLQQGRRLAVLPFQHHEEVLGCLLIACPGDCHCVTQEIEVLTLILKQTSGAIKRVTRHEEEIRELRERIEPSAEFCGLVGKDPKMQVIYKLIEDVAPTDASVLIEGESGTGKELVARAIHQLSERRDQPFVVINCSAYPATLLESELFGHEKGAFTGALRRKPGRFEQADGGTVFLDEIGEISASAQIKLLRVLQSQKFERLGGEETISVSLRILAATNKNLLDEVKKGHFREDLFYRLNVIPIELPPLRNRKNDIPLLAGHFLERYAGKQDKTVREFSSEAMRALLSYDWPGNVRELENSIEHAIVIAKDNSIRVPDLPVVVLETDSKKQAATRTIATSEELLLKETLEACGWNKTEAAARLGISRSTLYEKLKKYKIAPPTLH